MSKKGGNATSRLALTQPLKWHIGGGKGQGMAARIVAPFPPKCRKDKKGNVSSNAPADDDPGYLHYVEPYAGGLAVLLANDPTGVSEVVNDINVELTNFWTVLQNPALFDHFRRHAEAVPFSRPEWTNAGKPLDPDDTYPTYGGVNVARAVKFFVRVRQSMAGRIDSPAPITSNRTRQGMNEQAAAWLSAVDGLPAVHARLRRVVVLGPADGVDVIRRQDGPRTLFYLDPPYLHETRTATDVYKHEMTPKQHDELLVRLSAIAGRFALSGYRSSRYDQAAVLYNWRRVDFDRPNKSGNADAAGKRQRRTECVWMNYAENGERL